MGDDLHAVNPGEMRWRLEVQANTPTTTAKGEHVQGWSTVVTRWASIVPAAGQFFTASEQVRSKVSHKIVMRYYDGLTPKHRLKLGSRVFNILSVLDENELHTKHTILATEVLP